VPINYKNFQVMNENLAFGLIDISGGTLPDKISQEHINYLNSKQVTDSYDQLVIWQLAKAMAEQP